MVAGETCVKLGYLHTTEKMGRRGTVGMIVGYTALAKAFKSVRQFAGGMFNWVLLEKRGNELSLTATDLESWAKCTIPVEGDDEFRLGIGVKELAGVLANQAVRVVFEQDGLTARIIPKTAKGRSVEFELAGRSHEDFPDLNTDSTEILCFVSTTRLNDALSRVLFATLHDSVQIAYNGVLFEADGEVLYFVATDGKRLARTMVSAVDTNKSALVPSVLLRKAKSSLIGDEVEIALGEKLVMFTSQDYENNIKQQISIRLLDASFPSYREIFPSGFCLKMEIDRLGILDALAGARVINGDAVVFTIEGNTLRVGASGERGRFAEDIQLSNVSWSAEGKTLKVAFHPQQLIEPLKAVNDSSVQMSFVGEVQPAMLTAEDYEYLVMPLSVVEEEE